MRAPHSNYLPALALALCAAGWTASLQGIEVKPARKPAPPKLNFEKWSGDLNVPDPVACSVDEKGRVYVSATTRRKAADLDIREHTEWIPNDVAMRSIEDKQNFLHETLAPGKLRAPSGSLKDHNADGSIDWKDLTVHTERIYRIEDTDGDGKADKMTVFAEGFNTEVTGIAAGVLYHDGWVYATIAPDLWRFKDTDDDGVADVRESLVHGFGLHIAYAGHDMHGLEVGPDGRIYWSIGDKGVNAKAAKDGRTAYYPNEGCVMRIEPDGSGFEVFAHGLRNTQEVAFDEFGNLFSVDNDSDLPGEQERLVYITEGSDSGWRCNYQYMKSGSPWSREGIWKPRFPGQPAHITPPLANYSDGPAGFAWEPGTALGHGFRGLFFLDQFPSGKMDVLKLEPDGASFRMTEGREVHAGLMGIGMSWGPDGRLYVADWDGGYPLDSIGAIWRTDDAQGGNSEREETQKLLAAGFAKTNEDALIDQLCHADQRVRLGAQFELVKRKHFPLLADVALEEKAPLLARVHSIWGCGQGMRHGAFQAEQLLPLLKDAEVEVRAQTAKVMGDTPAAKSHGEALIPLLKDDSVRVRFHAAITLGKLGVPKATLPLVRMVIVNADRDAFLRHAAVTGLAGCASREDLHAMAGDPVPPVRLAALLAMRRLRDPQAALFLGQSKLAGDSAQDAVRLVDYTLGPSSETERMLAAEAARAIHDDESISEALPHLARVLDARGGFDEPTLRRAINANLRLGTADCAERVARYAVKDDAPPALRLEALQALRAWTQPPPLDRVDGWARKLEPRDPAVLKDAAQPHLAAMLETGDTDLKTAAVELIIDNQLEVSAGQAAAIVAKADAPGDLRGKALRLMAAQHGGSEPYQQALKTALSAKSPSPLRMAGLELVFAADAQRGVELAGKVLQGRSTAEKQHAIRLLGKAGTDAADKILVELADALARGRLAAASKLDLLEAMQARASVNTTIAGKLAAHEKARAGTTDLLAANPELLEGGDAAEGREIVLDNLAANCVACHTVESAAGSNVGPPLKAIGATRDRSYLLESLLNPSATLAEGYGMVAVTLKDGSSVSGALGKETKTDVTIRRADGVTEKIAKSKIATRTPPVSVMPPMLGILTPHQIRDVVAYLSGLTGKKSGKHSEE